MDFYDKWPETVAFIVSSSGIVYTLAYIAVIMIKTSMTINPVTMKVAALFFIAVNISFKSCREWKPLYLPDRFNK